MRLTILPILFSSIITSFAQDVNLESNSDNGELLHIENTGSTDKTAVIVKSDNTDFGVGLEVHATLSGMNLYTNNTANYGGPNGIYAETNSNTYNLGGITSFAGGGWDTRAINAYTTGNGGVTYGLYSMVGGGDNNIGIYAFADVNESNDAAFIDGDGVYTSSWSQFSDENLKTNITDMTGGLGKILALKPKLYDMKREEYKNSLNLSKDHQYGLLAQDVQAVLPELVRNVSVPQRRAIDDIKPGKPGQRKNLTRTTTQNFKALNYTGLIPILIEAMQEQNARIDSLQAAIASMKR